MRTFGKTLSVAVLVSAFVGFEPSVYAGLGSCPLGVVAKQPFSNGRVVKPRVHGGLGSSPLGSIRNRPGGVVVQPRVHGGLGGTPLGVTDDLRSNRRKAPVRQTAEDEFKVEKGELCPELIELMFGPGIWR